MTGPVGAMTFSPQIAIVILLVIDTLPMVPLIISALKKISLRELLPVAAGYGLIMPLGIWFLKTGMIRMTVFRANTSRRAMCR